MAGSFLNGFGGTATFGMTTHNVKSWNLDIDEEQLPTTNVSSLGWKESIGGVKSWSGAFELDLDTGTKPFTPLEIGTLGTLVLVYNQGSTWTGTARVKKISTKNPATQVVSYNTEFEGTGVLTNAT